MTAVSHMVLEREESIDAFNPGEPPMEIAEIRPPTQSAPDSDRQLFRGVASGHILVVDDEDQIRLFLRGALEDEGLTVETAASGQQAIALAELSRPALVVLDMMLPDVDGDAVAGELRARYGADLPILVITADTHAEDKAQRAGAFAYLHKPFDLNKLIQLVQQGLAH